MGTLLMTTKHLMNLNLNSGQCESRMDSLNDSMFQGYVDLIKQNQLESHHVFLE